MNRRISGYLVSGFLAFVLTTSAQALTFTVNSTADEIDAALGDGICLSAEGNCTLRAAVMEANVSAGADIIDLTAMNNPADPIVLTLEGVDELMVDAEPGPAGVPCVAEITADAAVGDLDITQDLEIFGAGPGLTVIKWANQSLEDPDVGDRIFHIQAPAGVTITLVKISDLMITGGSVGIPNSTDPENIYNCDVIGEPGSIVAWQFKRFGGGIAVGPGAAVTLFEESEHGGGGGSDEGPPDDPGGDEGEGGVTAVAFERLAMINNQAGADGGAILVAAEMTITDSVFSGNHSGANGGALYIDSATTIQGTLIGTSASDIPYASGAIAADLVSLPNTAENGGGIFDTGSHTTNIEASSINGNQAIGGGGIAARSLIVVNITNSTISGNTGTDVGGGITTNGTVNLRNVTVADNVATTDAPGGGGGLNAFGSGTYVFYNTILSNNHVTGDAAREANCGCSGGAAACPPGRMVSTGYNINDETIDTCSMSWPLNDQAATDPLLKPLTNNGGLTETHALPSQLMGDVSTSPAIDSGHNQRCPNNDQRGSIRPDDGNGDGSYICDVGAYELFVPRADLHINNVVAPNSVDKGDTFTAVVEIHNDDANVAAPAVEYTGALSTLTGISIVSASPSSGSCGVPSHTVACVLGDMAVGAVETVTLRLNVSEQGAYSLESVVQAAAGVIDPVPGNNIVISHVFALGSSDLALSVDVLPTSVDQGDTITFNYTVLNNGADDASSARLGADVPDSATFVSASSTKGDCADNGDEVLCSIGNLAVAESVAIEIQLSADVAGDTDYTAIAVADQTDPDNSNDSITSMITAIANADLALNATTSGGIIVDHEFNLTVTVTNNGPQDATNVLATAEIPALVTFVSSTDCALNGNMLECAVAQIAAGNSATFTIRLDAATVGSAAVTGSVVADENDPDEANNTLSLNVTISDPPPPPSSGGGGGGCVHNPEGTGDWTLPLVLALILLRLGMRRRPAVARC